MACGCAVIASDVGGNPELITPWVNGTLFQPGNVSELATHLVRLAQDEPLRRNLAAQAAQFVHENFSRQASVSRLTDLYLQLIRHKFPQSVLFGRRLPVGML